MIQQKKSTLGRLTGCVVLTLSACMLAPAAHAADEDIDIPYTDTYGYVYDPATGTFIKQDDSSTGTDTAASSTPPADANGTVTDTDTSSIASQPVTPETTARMSPLLTPAILLLLMVAALAGYRLFTRTNDKPAEDPR